MTSESLRPFSRSFSKRRRTAGSATGLFIPRKALSSTKNCDCKMCRRSNSPNRYAAASDTGPSGSSGCCRCHCSKERWAPSKSRLYICRYPWSTSVRLGVLDACADTDNNTETQTALIAFETLPNECSFLSSEYFQPEILARVGTEIAQQAPHFGG